MTLLDSFALIAFFTGERASAEVRELMDSDDCSITQVNLAEVFDVLMRVHEVTSREIDEYLAPLLGPVIEVLPTSMATSGKAGKLRAQYYHAKKCPLSLADCFLIATAAEGQRIATPDRPLAQTARAEGIDVVALQDSRGKRP